MLFFIKLKTVFFKQNQEASYIPEQVVRRWMGGWCMVCALVQCAPGDISMPYISAACSMTQAMPKPAVDELKMLFVIIEIN